MMMMMMMGARSGVVAYVVDLDIVVTEFQFHSCNYILFWTLERHETPHRFLQWIN